MEWNEQLWRQSQEYLSPFMIPLAEVLGRSERRVAASRYVAGLLLPGQRKSIAPMSERLGVDSQSLQQFVSDSPWEEQALWSAIRREIIPSLGPVRHIAENLGAQVLLDLENQSQGRRGILALGQLESRPDHTLAAGALAGDGGRRGAGLRAKGFAGVRGQGRQPGLLG